MEYLSKFQTRILDRLIYRDDIFDWNVVLKSTFLLPFFLDLEDTTIRRRIGKRYISRFSKTGKKKSQKGCVYMYTQIWEYRWRGYLCSSFVKFVPIIFHCFTFVYKAIHNSPRWRVSTIGRKIRLFVRERYLPPSLLMIHKRRKKKGRDKLADRLISFPVMDRFEGLTIGDFELNDLGSSSFELYFARY